ncbi:GIY-YIG nuclease family protein [Microbacterium sp.]|uniref:GIY-YIG nuclease family protein n=1 Tax=Microbacterium sp. TaxID=51671 RepID=UPI002FE25172
MTLHQTIVEVLTAAGHPLTARDVADEVNRRRLYVRADGQPLGASQVSARVRNYPGLFIESADTIWLVSHSPLPEARPAAPTPTPTQDALASVATATTPIPDVETALLKASAFQSARIVDGLVPDRFGLYAIRVHQGAALPSPFGDIARERESNLIYLGAATRQTLKKRFLGNELRGQGHGTFFRSLGAVLGYRPAVGSLVGKANQRNYRFSPADSATIVEWINANVDVSWVPFDDGVHFTEVALIRAHRPLLNLRDNPAALPQLSELRALCCSTAQGTTEEMTSYPAL